MLACRAHINVVSLGIHPFQPTHLPHDVIGGPEPMHHLALSAIPDAHLHVGYPKGLKLPLDGFRGAVTDGLEGGVPLAGVAESQVHNPSVSTAARRPVSTVSP